MSEEILEIQDVFQMQGRGTVLTGIRGHAWGLVRIGDAVELTTPDGRSMRNVIRDLEVFRKGVLDGPPFPGGILLDEAVGSDQLPIGTRVLRILS